MVVTVKSVISACLLSFCLGFALASESPERRVLESEKLKAEFLREELKSMQSELNFAQKNDFNISAFPIEIGKNGVEVCMAQSMSCLGIDVFVHKTKSEPILHEGYHYTSCVDRVNQYDKFVLIGGQTVVLPYSDLRADDTLILDHSDFLGKRYRHANPPMRVFCITRYL